MVFDIEDFDTRARPYCARYHINGLIDKRRTVLESVRLTVLTPRRATLARPGLIGAAAPVDGHVGVETETI